MYIKPLGEATVAALGGQPGEESGSGDVMSPTVAFEGWLGWFEGLSRGLLWPAVGVCVCVCMHI